MEHGLERMGKSAARTAAAALLAFGAILAAPEAVRAQGWSMDAVNGASLNRTISSSDGMDPAMVKAQVMLDRAHFSPGVIDGYYGGNSSKALRVFQSTKGLQPTGNLDPETWRALTSSSQAPALTTYTISKDDVDGPFVENIPSRMKEMAKMDRMAYTSPKELLSEKFHMHPRLLERLNPGKSLDKQGTEIVVANVRENRTDAKVKTIVVDKKVGAVKAFADGGRLIAVYPATIGSDQYPAPDGSLKVNGVATDPVFTYSGDLDYSDLKKGEELKIPPGPNNPVGTVWIDLSKQGYGIHGTPEPAKVSKNYSHGCIRLTNWDAQELGEMVSPGVKVNFHG